MAYTLHLVINNGLAIGDMVTSGQTRQQIVNALKNLGWVRTGDDVPPMPKFKLSVMVCNPRASCYPSFVIKHV